MPAFIEVYETTLLGSLMSLPSSERIVYIRKVLALPSSLAEMTTDVKVASFIRGLSKTQQIPNQQIPQLSFLILQIVLGEQSLANLSQLINQRLQLALEKCQKISQEVERELFAPISLELNSYLNQSKKFGQPKPATPPLTKPSAQSQGVRNVVDLKQATPRPPVAPPMPPNRPRPGMAPLPNRPASSTSNLPLDKDTLKRKSQLWQAK